MVGGFLGLFTFLFIGGLIYTPKEGFDEVGEAAKIVVKAVVVLFIIAAVLGMGN